MTPTTRTNAKLLFLGTQLCRAGPSLPPDALTSLGSYTPVASAYWLLIQAARSV